MSWSFVSTASCRTVNNLRFQVGSSTIVTEEKEKTAYHWELWGLDMNSVTNTMMAT